MSKQLFLLTCVSLIALACGEKESSLTPGAGGSNTVGGASTKGGTSSNKAGSTAKGGSSAAKGGASGGEGGSSDEVGGTGPSEGGSSSTETDECLIIPTEESGWVDATKNDCKVQGAWYSNNDCSTSPDDCTQDQVPAAGSDGFPNTGAKMCTSGTTVAIKKQYDTKWGAGIALNLKQRTDSDAKSPISELPHALTGFSFTITGNTVPGEVRVIYPTAATAKNRGILVVSFLVVMFRVPRVVSPKVGRVGEVLLIRLTFPSRSGDGASRGQVTACRVASVDPSRVPRAQRGCVQRATSERGHRLERAAG